MTDPRDRETITRRTLLRLSALAAGGAALTPLGGCWDSGKTPPPAPPAPAAPPPAAPVASTPTHRGTIIGPGRFVQRGETKFVLSAIDLDTKERKPRTTPLSFFAHGVVPNPIEPRKAALFEKKGKGACEVDLVEGKVLRSIPTEADRQFYGHGAYLPDGSVLFATETITSGEYKGVIAIRDAKTLEALGTFSSYGSSPHDCRLLDGGKTIAITNGGGPLNGGSPPNVTYVDVASHKLLEKVEFSTPKVNAGHLLVSAKGDLAVVSAPRDGMPDPQNQNGGVTLKPKGESALTMTSPEDVTSRLKGEVLSLALHEPTGVVAATCPLGNLVTFWDLRKQTLLKKLDALLPRAVALTLDGKHFVITHNEVDILFVTTDGLEVVPDDKVSQTFMTGSHLITYAMPS